MSKKSFSPLPTDRGVGHAIRESLEGWPPYFVLFRRANPTRRVVHPIFRINIENIPANRIFARTQNDPLTRAPDACGAVKVATRDSRMLGLERQLQVSLSTKDYGVRPLPRPRQVDENAIGSWKFVRAPLQVDEALIRRPLPNALRLLFAKSAFANFRGFCVHLVRLVILRP